MTISFRELRQMQELIDQSRQANWSQDETESYKMALALSHVAESNVGGSYTKQAEVNFAMKIVKMLD